MLAMYLYDTFCKILDFSLKKVDMIWGRDSNDMSVIDMTSDYY